MKTILSDRQSIGGKRSSNGGRGGISTGVIFTGGSPDSWLSTDRWKYGGKALEGEVTKFTKRLELGEAKTRPQSNFREFLDRIGSALAKREGRRGRSSRQKALPPKRAKNIG